MKKKEIRIRRAFDCGPGERTIVVLLDGKVMRTSAITKQYHAGGRTQLETEKYVYVS